MNIETQQLHLTLGQLGQGLAKSESIMGAILALSPYFQRMSYVCK